MVGLPIIGGLHKSRGMDRRSLLAHQQDSERSEVSLGSLFYYGHLEMTNHIFNPAVLRDHFIQVSFFLYGVCDVWPVEFKNFVVENDIGSSSFQVDFVIRDELSGRSLYHEVQFPSPNFGFSNFQFRNIGISTVTID